MFEKHANWKKIYQNWVYKYLMDLSLGNTHNPVTRASEKNFRLQRKVWSPKYIFHSFIHFKISASARRARFSDALILYDKTTMGNDKSM